MKCSPPTDGATEPQTSTLTNIIRKTPISPPRRRIENALAQFTANVQNPIQANNGSHGTITRTRLTTTLNKDRRTSIRLKKRSTRASIGSHQKSVRVQKGSRSTNNGPSVRNSYRKVPASAAPESHTSLLLEAITEQSPRHRCSLISTRHPEFAESSGRLPARNYRGVLCSPAPKNF